MRWNYAEHCARQLLRKNLPGGAIDDPDHLKLSGRQAWWIEEELRECAASRWLPPGLPYLHCLIDAFAVAREHRNYFVHGMFMTADAGVQGEARGVIVPTKPVGGRAPLPKFVMICDLKHIADHFNELGEFACDVNNGFDRAGGRALNADGSFVLSSLPAMISPLPVLQYEFL